MKEKQIYEKKKMEGKFREKTRKLLKVILCLLFMVTVFTVPDVCPWMVFVRRPGIRKLKWNIMISTGKNSARNCPDGRRRCD